MPTPMSARTDRAVGRVRARSGSCSGRAIVRTRAADAAKLMASTPSRVAGCATASARPTSDGNTISAAVADDHTTALALAIRSLPTRTGRAPKLAPSKNTAIAGPPKATTIRCGTVRTSSRYATGTDDNSSASETSAMIIWRRRSSRSASAPANSPNSTYGAASSIATVAVNGADPLIR
jgi:hypothetical protein